MKNHLSFKSTFLSVYDYEIGTEFEIIFKCMSGATTENGKFIMPLQEKMSYNDSSDRCNS